MERPSQPQQQDHDASTAEQVLHEAGLLPERPHASARADFTPYPANAHQCTNGRRAWELGEDGDDALLVEGHGPAARAALAEVLVERHKKTRTDADTCVALADLAGHLKEHHVAFLTTCGCTVHGHVKHLKLARLHGGGPEDVQLEVCEGERKCQASGLLPPCAPAEAPPPWSLPPWIAVGVPPTDARALPVLEVALDDVLS